jgi:quercetin dioxygenase-like cupin family protein
MHVTKHADAVPYDPPFHEGVDCRRLQGMEIGPTDGFWMGLSVYPPGSSAGPSEVMGESIYLVVSGEFVLRCNGETTALRQYDSVHLAKGDHRELVNESDSDAVLAVSIANPPKSV